MKKNILLVLFFVAGLSCYNNQLQASLPKVPAKRVITYPFRERMQQLDTVVGSVKDLMNRVLDQKHPQHISSAQAQNFLKQKYREVTNPNLLSHAQKAVITAADENKEKVQQQYGEFKDGLTLASQLIVDTKIENMNKFLDLVQSKAVEYESSNQDDALNNFTRLAGYVGAVNASKLAPLKNYEIDFSDYNQTCNRHKQVYLEILQKNPSNFSAIKFGKHMPAVDLGMKIAKPIGTGCVYVADKVLWAAPRTINWSLDMAGCAGDAWSQENPVVGAYDGLSPLAGLGLAALFVKKAWTQNKGKTIPMRFLCTAKTIACTPMILAGMISSVIGAIAPLQHISANKKRNDGFFYEHDDQGSSSMNNAMRIASLAAFATSAYCYKNINFSSGVSKAPAAKAPVSLEDNIIDKIKDVISRGIAKCFKELNLKTG